MGSGDRKQHSKSTGSGAREHSRRSGRGRWIAAVAVALAAVLGLTLFLERDTEAAAIEFTDVREQTKEFIGYNDSIQLTPEQEAIKKQALTAIPAPCCSDNSAYTCCCPCNMAKTWWGLANYLIAREGYDADQVRAAVEEWIEFIGPEGFSGNACYTGGCMRPFHRNGCGGMHQGNVVF